MAVVLIVATVVIVVVMTVNGSHTTIVHCNVGSYNESIVV
jgi:hypothetical protein